jgi:ribonuclease HI
MDLDLYCDGASRGNPGPAAIGIVVVDHDTDAVLAKTGKTIGEKTNNEAEYEAIKRGLTLAWKDYKASTVRVYSDSQLVIRQLTGQYKVKKEELQELLEEVEIHAEPFYKVFYKEVPREHPMIQLADKAANEALDK